MTEHEIIPSWQLPLYSILLPVIIMAFYIFAVKRFSNQRLLVSFLGLFLAMSVTLQITTLLKAYVGRLRPDFLSRCNVDLQSVGKNVCLGSPKHVKEGRKSFPSGHTSSAFAGLTYAGFFLAGQMQVFDGMGYTYKFILSLLPFGVASFVGISRVVDYRHHWTDVFAGAFIGTLMAYLSYRLHFPSIMDINSQVPFPQRFQLLSDEDDRLCENVPNAVSNI